MILYFVLTVSIVVLNAYKYVPHYSSNYMLQIGYESKSKLLMVKSTNEVFYCTECGVEHVRWVGRCTSCNEWNCVKPMRVPKLSQKEKQRPLDPRSLIGSHLSQLPGKSPSWLPQGNQAGTMVSMNTIDSKDSTLRHNLESMELNRVLGGGLVRGSTVLLAGEPGIGKSTLLIQLAQNLVKTGCGTVVYISGEENPQQIAARAARLNLSADGIFLLCDVDVDRAGEFSHNILLFFFSMFVFSNHQSSFVFSANNL